MNTGRLLLGSWNPDVYFGMNVWLGQRKLQVRTKKIMQKRYLRPNIRWNKDWNLILREMAYGDVNVLNLGEINNITDRDKWVHWIGKQTWVSLYFISFQLLVRHNSNSLILCHNLIISRSQSAKKRSILWNRVFNYCVQKSISGLYHELVISTPNPKILFLNDF